MSAIEYLDIYDLQCNPTGRTFERGQPLEGGDCYLGIHAYIRNAQGLYLIQQRALNKSFRPGKWDVLLGHVLAGEASMEAMRREVQEEVGLVVPQDAIEAVQRIHWEGMHHFTDVYFLRLDFALQDVVLQTEEVMAAKLVTADEMGELVAGQLGFRPEAYRSAVVELIKQLA